MSVRSELFKRLSQPRARARTEAEIQSDVRQLLLGEDFGLDTPYGVPRLEEQVGDGTRRRIDVAVGATVIEVKKSLESTATVAEHEAQLGGYVAQRMQQSRTRYNGILTDGRTWWLYEIDPATEELTRRSVFELSTVEKAGSLVEWLQAVLATHSNVKPTKSTIEAYLGASSPAYAQDKAFLSALYETLSDDPTVALKQQLWGKLLRSALGTSFEESQDLFINHTMLVIEAMAIGHAVMGVPLAELAADIPRFMRGDEFENSGIRNVMEPGFFDWILAAEDGQRFAAQIVRRVGVFDWSQIDHDVLKVLYESIIGARTRKHLGEYYTPDWLAEGIVAEVVTDPLSQRVLDPACGSGTFPFHVIRRMTAAATEAGWTNRQIVSHVQNHVFGLDIHPVSIVLARITYLLALGEHLMGERGDVWVPIHLGDSIQWHQPANYESNTVRIDTTSTDLTVESEEGSGGLFSLAHILAFPLTNIDDPGTFDRLVTELTDRASQYTDPRKSKPSIASVLNKYAIPAGDDFDTLVETFNLLCDLNAEGRDSIWGYFVRNQVRPLWLSMDSRRVDVLVGNPPWVAYRYMTPAMQEQFREFSQHLNLWHGRTLATHQDLVGLFIARAAERYLRDGGKFGFVTPLALLNRQQYEGFRAGKWGQRLRGQITTLWDLDKVRPKGDLFPVPAGVIFGTRATHEIGVDARTVPYGTTSEKVIVEGLRDVTGWEASKTNFTFTTVPNRALTATSDESGSPYRANVIQGANIVPRSLFFVVEEPSTSRLGMSAGRMAVRSARSNLEKPPWKNLEDLTGVIENRHLYDVHLGSTIAPFRLLTPWKAILPIENDKLLTEEVLEHRTDGLGAWWQSASERWEENKSKSSRLSLWDQLNYQNKLTRQLGANTHRVVYSASGTSIAAARLDDPRAAIEHALYWLPARNKEEARYLTAILNAPITTTTVADYQSRGLFGRRHFDTYVWRLPIPRYDAADPLHRELANLASEAEELAATVDIDNVGFQAARSRIRKALELAGLASRLDLSTSSLFDVTNAIETPDK